ncbi:MerR family transcriptional regulator [Cytobacillus sp. FJAT-54145]|uniref:MerR family transcriptional regulator n=1 Tax=Cytobacillus spartinae TaxID=3299023 RepID=A0ABW6KBJ5_9BACI
MGELASIAKVSKRTIDYYTNLGLLQAERSKANYRIYAEEAISDLKFIEECKSLHFPLEEIKRKLELKKEKDLQKGEVEKHIHSVAQQMKQLQNDLSTLIPLINNLNDQQVKDFSKELTTEGEMLLKSLLRFTS